MTKPAVLHAFPLPHRARAPLAERYDLHGPLDASAPEAVPEAARGARALVTLGGLRTDAALMAAPPDLGLIACYGTGYEGVDRAAAAARGILVTHGGDANATSVAEFAMGLVLAAARLVLRGDGLVRDLPAGNPLLGNLLHKMGMEANAFPGFAEFFAHLAARRREDRVADRRLVIVLDALNEAPSAAQVLHEALSQRDPAVLTTYPKLLDAEYGQYFKVARLFAGIIGRPVLMRELTRVGMQSRTLMEWVLRIMANLLRPDELGPAEAAYKAVALIARVAPEP